jgi:hypothetical protein
MQEQISCNLREEFKEKVTWELKMYTVRNIKMDQNENRLQYPGQALVNRIVKLLFL